MVDQAIGGDAESDEALVAQVRDGETDAFELLYRRHYRGLLAYARMCSRSESDADDLVSEALAATYQRILAGGGPERGFVTYVKAAIRNSAISMGARRSREVVRDDLEREIEETQRAADVTEDLLGLAVIDRVNEAFSELRSDWQKIVWRVDVEGDRVRDVAAECNMTQAAVSHALYRAHEALREEFLTKSVDMQPCSQFSHRQLASYVRGSSPPGRAGRIAGHMPACPSCQAAVLTMGNVRMPTRRLLGSVLLGWYGVDLSSRCGGEVLSGASSLSGAQGTQGISWFAARWGRAGLALVASAVVVTLVVVLNRPDVPDAGMSSSAPSQGSVAAQRQAEDDGAALVVPVDGPLPSESAGSGSHGPTAGTSDSETQPSGGSQGAAMTPSGAPSPVVPRPAIPGVRSAAWLTPGSNFAPGARNVTLELLVDYSNSVSGADYQIAVTLPPTVNVVKASGGCQVLAASVVCTSNATSSTAESLKWLFVVDVAQGDGAAVLPDFVLSAPAS